MTSAQSSETERLRKIYDKQAPGFDRQMAFFERLLFGGGREWACGQASGDVLEIAVGTGRNLQHFPAAARLTGIEFSPRMLEIAKEHATSVRPDADLRLGDAQGLDFPDASFDTVVCTLSLCTIPDDARAVAEMHRVLRPGGRLILMEHVGSPNRRVLAVQRLIERITVPLEGDHQTREPLHHLKREGFEIETVTRLKWGIVERVVAHKAGQLSKED